VGCLGMASLKLPPDQRPVSATGSFQAKFSTRTDGHNRTVVQWTESGRAMSLARELVVQGLAICLLLYASLRISRIYLLTKESGPMKVDRISGKLRRNPTSTT
jgi:hypothetical protein